MFFTTELQFRVRVYVWFKSGPILERKGMRAIFQKKSKKRAKYFKIWAKMYKL